MITSLAEALAALTDARAARNRAEDERDAALTAQAIADVQRDAAEGERDELRAALEAVAHLRLARAGRIA